MNINNNRYKSFDLELSVKQLKENSHWFLGLGISLVVLGALAIIFSYATTLLSVVYFGIFMIIVGCVQAVKSYKINLWATFLLHLFLSVLYIICGLFIVLYPAVNAISLTLLLALFFIISGILKIVFALCSHVPCPFWLLFNGFVTLFLGGCIWSEWPMSGLWVIGTLLGIEAVITGWTFIMLSLLAKKPVEQN